MLEMVEAERIVDLNHAQGQLANNNGFVDYMVCKITQLCNYSMKVYRGVHQG